MSLTDAQNYSLFSPPSKKMSPSSNSPHCAESKNPPLCPLEWKGRLHEGLTLAIFMFLFLQVTWLRHRHAIPQVLAQNDHTMAWDKRIKSIVGDNNSEFTLRITHTRLRDGGLYECQVSGGILAPTLFRIIRLDVVGNNQINFYWDWWSLLKCFDISISSWFSRKTMKECQPPLCPDTPWSILTDFFIKTTNNWYV